MAPSLSRELRKGLLAGCGGASVLLLCPPRGQGVPAREEASLEAFLNPAGRSLRGPPPPLAVQSGSTAAAAAAGATQSRGLAGAAVLGSSAVALGALQAKSLRKSLRRSKRVRRHFFGGLEQLNPLYKSPEEQTRERYSSRVEEVNSFEESFKSKSDDELRELTAQLQERAQKDESLDTLLPQAFALVREASARVLGLRHFEVQLIGGMALHEGNIAEMGTGEGKTLVAILPAFLNALRGKGCHVVTVNDYLARRDAEWVGQPLRFLGLSVGVVQGGMSPDQRQKAYRCDVTYVTNSELGFDYLRDQMAPSPGDLCLREKDPFQFAIVDEVDSILIDEARTPLIISGTASNPSGKYEVAREVAKALRKTIHYTVDEKQRACILIEEGVEAAEKLVGKDDLFDPQDPWFPFISNALSAKEIYVKDKAYIVKRGEIMIVDEFTGRVMDGRRWSNGLHQAVEAKEGVKIQPESITLASISYQSLFRLFNKLGGMTGTAFTEAKEFDEIYRLKTVVVPPNRERKREDRDDQVFVDDIGKWKAVARDIANANRIGRPVLIGTTSVENSEIIAELLDALGVPYRLLNAKPENVARETEIIAGSGRRGSVTIATNMAGRGTDILLGGNSSVMARLKLKGELFQRLFPKMKGAVMPEDFYPAELSQKTTKALQEAVDRAVKAWSAKSKEKPTTLEAAEKILSSELTSLQVEERLSLACERAPTDDEVLLQLREAYGMVAGEFKEITDIEKLEVINLGGLYVIGTERHESRRIDNQLRGRSARQGDVGASRFFLSLNDNIFRIFGGEQIKGMMKMTGITQSDDMPLESGLLSNSLEEAQKKVENYFYSVRKNLFEYDGVMDTQRQIVYELRRRALLDDDKSISDTMREFSDKNMEDFVKGHILNTEPVEKWNLDKLAENIGIYAEDLKEKITEEMLVKAAGGGGPQGEAAVLDLLKKAGKVAFDEKLRTIEASGPGLAGVVMRQVLLMQLDQFWQQHLKNMDFLKTSVTLRAYGQKNPLTEYKLEGYQVFLKMMARIRRNAVYNTLLFTPRKLAPMSKERVESLIPNRAERRAQLKEALKLDNMDARSKRSGTDPTAGGAASKTINLARLALTTRQLLEARGELGDMALASFGELSEGFARAGLLTVGDQLRWAMACSEFELLEDSQNGEIYIGLVGRMEADPDRKPTQMSDQEYRAAKEAFDAAMENPSFLSTIDEFSQSPEAFLQKMKDSAGEAGWNAEDAVKLRNQYKAMGVDVDQLMKQMSEAEEDLPEAQKAVLQYMKQMLMADGIDASGEPSVKEDKVEADVTS